MRHLASNLALSSDVAPLYPLSRDNQPLGGVGSRANVSRSATLSSQARIRLADAAQTNRFACRAGSRRRSDRDARSLTRGDWLLRPRPARARVSKKGHAPVSGAFRQASRTCLAAPSTIRRYLCSARRCSFKPPPRRTAGPSLGRLLLIEFEQRPQFKNRPEAAIAHPRPAAIPFSVDCP